MPHRKPKGKAGKPHNTPPTNHISAANIQQLLSTADHYRRTGNLAEAKSVCEIILKQYTDQADTLHYLGLLEYQTGHPERGIQYIRRAINVNPSIASFHSNLGKMLHESGKQQEAIVSLETAVRLAPDDAVSLVNVAVALQVNEQYNNAEKYYKLALDKQPGLAGAHFNLGALYQDEGRFQEAAQCYKKGLKINPNDGYWIRSALAIPPIMESIEHIRDTRQRLNRNVAELLAQDLHVADPVREIGQTNFYLAYHGEDDIVLQKKFSELFIRACPSLDYIAPHCQNDRQVRQAGRIKIGFISKFLRNHSIGKTSSGIIKHLSRDLFEVTVIFTSPPDDEIGCVIRDSADAWIVLPNDLTKAQTSIANLKLDILFYQDTGMDPFTYFLGFARLAPVQCTSFGHPVTTGVPNLDYYISADLWEPEGAEKHYSEKLIRLQNVGSVAYYIKPKLPSQLKPRSYFGLQNEHHIYVSPQTLYKFHPDFDEILAGILRQDPLARVVLIEDKRSNFGKLLRSRFASAMPDVEERIIFLPRQNGADFPNLLAVSDVMLDTVHFCGFNTSLEGFSVGTPIVTMPGRFMRSRHTYTFYRKMGIIDCIATTSKEYVSIAVRIATDSTYQKELRQKILYAQDILWEETEVVRKFEKFFIDAVKPVRDTTI